MTWCQFAANKKTLPTEEFLRGEVKIGLWPIAGTGEKHIELSKLSNKRGRHRMGWSSIVTVDAVEQMLEI